MLKPAKAILLAFMLLTATAQAQIKVACIGNSITEGFGLDSGEKKFPAHMQEMLGDEYLVKNFGHSGRVFYKGHFESYWISPKFSQAIEFEPDIVIIELGTNDSKFFYDGSVNSAETNPYFEQATIQEFYEDYGALIDTFANQPQAPRIYATLAPAAWNYEWYITDSVIVNTINPLIEQVAEEKGATVVDLHKFFNNPDWYQEDQVHPNAQGDEELARIIVNAMLNIPMDSNATADTTAANTTGADTISVDTIAVDTIAVDTISVDSTDYKESSSSEEAIDSELSSSSETSSSSYEARTARPKHDFSISVSAEGKSILIENFYGKITVFDVNGNFVTQERSIGYTEILIDLPGAYVIKIGPNTQRVLLK